MSCNISTFASAHDDTDKHDDDHDGDEGDDDDCDNGDDVDDAAAAAAASGGGGLVLESLRPANNIRTFSHPVHLQSPCYIHIREHREYAESRPKPCTETSGRQKLRLRGKLVRYVRKGVLFAYFLHTVHEVRKRARLPFGQHAHSSQTDGGGKPRLRVVRCP